MTCGCPPKTAVPPKTGPCRGRQCVVRGSCPLGRRSEGGRWASLGTTSKATGTFLWMVLTSSPGLGGTAGSLPQPRSGCCSAPREGKGPVMLSGALGGPCLHTGDLPFPPSPSAGLQFPSRSPALPPHSSRCSLVGWWFRLRGLCRSLSGAAPGSASRLSPGLGACLCLSGGTRLSHLVPRLSRLSPLLLCFLCLGPGTRHSSEEPSSFSEPCGGENQG